MNYNHHMSESQHKENQEQMEFLEYLEHRDDYLYQGLKEDYNKYLKENKEHTATFYEWVQSVLPEYM